MMNEGAGEVAQVLSVEVEGIKVALGLSKGAVKLAFRIAVFLYHLGKDAKYRKEMGKTHIKNLKSRAGGGELVPLTMTKESYVLFKKYAKSRGILFHEIKPLKSAKRNGNIQVMVRACDVPATQDLLSQIKEEFVKKSVKKGMSEADAEKDFDSNNRFETMDEFAKNAGVTAPQKTFDLDMKERFGEDYEEVFIMANRTGRKEEKKLKEAAGYIERKERAKQYIQNPPVQLHFQYDEKKRFSQIIEETDTHIKIYRKWKSGNDQKQDAWVCLWLPKNTVLKKDADDSGIWTAVLQKEDVVVAEDPAGRKPACRMTAEDVSRRVEGAPDRIYGETKAIELPDSKSDKPLPDGVKNPGFRTPAAIGRKK